MSFEDRKKLINKYVKAIKILWVDDTWKTEKVNYYIVTVEYKINDIIEVYTNGYGLQLDEWFKIKYDKQEKLVYFDYAFNPKDKATIMEVPFVQIGNDVYPDYSSLAPYGETNLWDYSDYCDYYGEARYKKLKAELEHKIHSKFLKNLLPQH
jgi:hypothetical protein